MKPSASARKRPPARQYTDDGDGGPPQPPARKMPPSKSASAGRSTRPDLEEKGLAPGSSSTSVAMMAAAQGGSSHHRRPKHPESSLAKELPTKTAAPQAVARGSAAGRPKQDRDYYNEDDNDLKIQKNMALGGSSHRRPQQRQSSFARELPATTMRTTTAPQAVARGSGRPKEDDYHSEDYNELKMKKDMALGGSSHRRPKQRESSFARELPATTVRPTTAPQAVARGSGRPKEDYDYYNEDYNDLKMEKKMALGGEKDSVSLGYFGSEEEKIEEATQNTVQPGAVHVPGIASGQSQSLGSVVSSNTPHSLPGDSGGENPVHAFLVDEQLADLPLRVDAQAVEYKPWYKRPPVILSLLALVLLFAGILVGVVLAVTLTRDNGGGNGVETQFPTSSPAPTALADITMVIQLNSQPAETGWSLVCDDQEVQDVPQGSYAFLPIGVLIPSYRLEVTESVVAGSECVFTITDAGGDGLSGGGFFELYYGDDVGNPDSLLERGVPLSSSQSVFFTVAPPSTRAPTPVAPTVPTNAPTPDTNVTCTVCPDGSQVPIADLLLNDLGKTCGELDEDASNVLENSTICAVIQTNATRACGCTNFCDTICPDGSLIDPSQEEALVSIENGQPRTCGDVQDSIMTRDSSVDDCNKASFFGEEFCSCPGEGTFCRICEPGGSSQIPGNLSREIIPGVACEDISGIAYTLLTGDPRFSFICPAYLSIGEYCDCPEVENPRTFCRLCGDRLLPEPDRIVFSPLLNTTTTCFHVEFYSNLGIMPNGTTSVISDCSVVQDQGAAECCA